MALPNNGRQRRAAAAALRAPSPLLQIPFSLVASGPSGCGKSWWVRQLLLNPSHYCRGGHTLWHRVFYFSRFPLVALQADLVARSPLTIEFHQGDQLPTVEQLLQRCRGGPSPGGDGGGGGGGANNVDDMPQILVVLDDMVEQACASSDIRSIFTEGRHTGFSILLTSQNLFHPGKYAVTIRRNAVYVMLWESVMDRQQVRNFFQRQLPLRWRELLRFYDDATRQPYGYLFIDRRTPLLRYRTRMTSRHQTIYMMDGPVLSTARAAVAAAIADSAAAGDGDAGDLNAGRTRDAMPLLVVGGTVDALSADTGLSSRVQARLAATLPP